MFEIAPGDTVTDQFAVFENDGITKHTGLLPGSFAVVAWRDGVVTPLVVALSEVGSSGEYKMVYTPLTPGFWKVEVFSSFSDEYYVSTAVAGVGATIAGVKGDTELILGLLHLNSMLDQQVFDGNGDLTSTRLRCFNSPGNVPATPGGSEVTGLKFQLLVEVSYTAPGKPDKFTLKRVL